MLSGCSLVDIASETIGVGNDFVVHFDDDVPRMQPRLKAGTALVDIFQQAALRMVHPAHSNGRWNWRSFLAPVFAGCQPIPCFQVSSNRHMIVLGGRIADPAMNPNHATVHIEE